MAEQVVSDLIMKFVDDKGEAIPGECSTEVHLRKCDMSKGFDKLKMFEVESFQFKTGLDPDDEETVKQRKEDERKRNEWKLLQKSMQAQHLQNGGKGKISLPDPPRRTNPSGSFARFRAGADTTYPVDISPIEFSRSIDISSSRLLQDCIKRRPYRSATLIKRRPTGGPLAGEIFLRFDFEKVLLTKVDVDNDDPIKVKCQFICRAVTIHYLPQLPDGSLGAPLQAFWTMSNLTPFNLKG